MHVPAPSLIPLLALAALLPARISTPDPQRASGGARTVYVSVVDARSVPIPDLTAADFTVREDGRARPIALAEVSRTPMLVALLIDDSGLGLQSMREAAGAFVTRLRGAASISITTTGGHNIKVQDFTTSTPTLVSVINRLYGRPVSGSYLVEGLAGAASEFIRREATRPVIVSIGVEDGDYSLMRGEEALATLQQSAAQVYMVRLGRPIVGQGFGVAIMKDNDVDQAIIANAVYGQAPSRSGGRIEQISLHTGIPAAVDQIATELLGQYAITYVSANLGAPDLRFQVETSRRGAKVRAQTRVGAPRR